MVESLDSTLTQQRQEQRSLSIAPAWNDKRDARNDVAQLFAKPSSTASLDNLDTASLYRSQDKRHSSENNAAKPESQHASTEIATAQRNAEAPIRQSEHKVKAGETLETIARQKLGQNASDADVQRYVDFVASVNNLDGADPRPGKSIVLPERTADNTLKYTNPDNRKETWVLNPDGSSCHHEPLDKHGSYTDHYDGPDAHDRYDQTYNHKFNTTVISRQQDNGDTVETRYSGKKTDNPEATKTIHPNGDWEETDGPNSQLVSARYIADKKISIEHMKDGGIVTTYFQGEGDHQTVQRTETVSKEGSETVKTTRTPDGSYSIERTDADGKSVSSVNRKYFNNGGYSEAGKFVKDGKQCSYNEQFDAQTGTTRRTEFDGNGKTVTTRTKDGTVCVEAPDGTKTTTRKDGSEVVEKNGIKISEKSAYDYQHNPEINSAREQLQKSVTEHIPADKQAAFKKDMAAFEERAAKEHLSPSEITKAYQSMAKMLNAQEAAVPAESRALLAESLIHQCAHPQDTQQGMHNTCNVTSVAEITLVKNPSKAAEMACTAAVEGKWTAPDGKVITLDKNSLEPGTEEETYPPKKSGDRTYATQLLNLVMINDALQRRDDPQTYQQRKPDASAGAASEDKDTGERILDSHGNVIKDGAGKPVSGPDITDSEIAQVSKRINGTDGHLLVVDDAQGSVDTVCNENQLRHRLLQLRAQGQFPITLGVDGCHWPITGMEHPGYGGHVVTIDGYDPKTGKVHVTNQWGKRSNRWVSIADLYENASGKTAASLDGSNQVWN